ncbi:MAG TPA: D-alanyl-D-alanine carboxypeptidase/D-alanyl-D-alanine-endopeptidase [Paracoccaceae bacterium]|nr:D-alanyl-D-alanine carboxypeptidase/D-alanyl-D-alanine-endopeptidase [Paracoccaceae bacterium]HMO70504.1 D-alanyl-D-alanine carboxypeptidase/D-alanyl-D-alanine-endopeptidase [Paracoccaceae bacterium]
MNARSLSRRHLLAGLAASIALPACAEAPARSIRPAARPSGGAEGASLPAAARGGIDLAALVAAARLGGTTACALVDAETGRPLDGLSEGTTLPPASTAKAMTALFALDRLGTGRRFVTRIVATGPVQGGAVQGDLVLVGGGDPTLQTDMLAELAARLAAAGVRGVTGRFLVHGGALPRIARIDRDQPDHVGYNPTISGMMLNFNRVHFEWKRAGQGWALAMDARGQKVVPAVRMAEVRAVNRQSPLFTYEETEGRDRWTVAAPALGKGGSRWLPVRNPELYAGEVFQTLAAARGIRVPAPRPVGALPGGRVVAEIASDPMPVLLRDMLRFSTNITAEAIGLAASGAGSLAASGAAMSDWARGRYGVASRLVDHSGLGGASRISPADMALALARGRGSGLAGILREQGMRDEDGREIKGHPVRVPAKTGTLNFVSGLAGYIRPPGRREMAFAVFSADADRRDGLPREAREQPPGGAEWTRRARLMQGRMVSRWAARFA